MAAPYAFAMLIAQRGASRSSNPNQMTTPIRTRSTAPSRPAVLPRVGPVPITYPILVGIVHWLIVQITASLAYRYGRSTADSAPFRTMPEPLEGIVGTLVNPLRTWDGLWYRLISIEGYDYHTANAAFWPFFPWTIRALTNLTGMSPELAGYLIANVSFFVALVLLFKLVCLDFDEHIARVTVWAIALFPTAFFFTAIYTESPFLLFSVGCLYAARRKQWWLAGLIGALAALTRSYGMFLVFPLAVLFLQDRGFYIRRLFPTGFSVALPLLGPAIFSWRLNEIWDDPLAWKNVQEQWNRFSATPWETMRYAFSQSPEGKRIGIRDGADWAWMRDLINDFRWATVVSEPWRQHVANSDTLELVCTLLFMALAIVGIWKLPLYQTAFLVPGLVVPLFQPSSVHVLMSMPRFGLTLFPIFVMIGILLVGRRWLSISLALVSTAGLILLTIQFSQWYWVS